MTGQDSKVSHDAATVNAFLSDSYSQLREIADAYSPRKDLTDDLLHHSIEVFLNIPKHKTAAICQRNEGRFFFTAIVRRQATSKNSKFFRSEIAGRSMFTELSECEGVQDQPSKTQDRLEFIDKKLEGMAYDERALWYLHHEGRLTFDKLEALTGISKSTVIRIIVRLRKDIITSLKEWESSKA